MSKMIGKLNFNKILVIFILLQPLIDVVTSLLVRNVSDALTIGIVVRTIFMIGIVLYAFIISDIKVRKKLLIYYVAVAVYIIAYFFFMYKEFALQMIVTQAKGIVKAFYLPIILVAFWAMTKNKNKLFEVNNSTLIYSLLGYVAIIFIARILNLGYETYDIGNNIGTIGWFFAANEIGCVITILAPFLFIEIINRKLCFNKINVIYFLTLFLYIFAVLEIGTKVPFIGLIGLMAVAIIYCIINIIKKDKNIYSKKLVIFILISLATIIFLPSTPIGKNIEMNYQISLPNVMSVFEKPGGLKPEIQEPSKEVVTQIMSSRDLFLKDNLEKYSNANIMNQLIGIGYLTLDNGTVEPLKLIEMDYFDVFFNHGIIGSLLILLPMIGLCLRILILALIKIKKVITDTEIMLITYSLLIGLATALIAGHVLVAPAVAIYIIFDLIILRNKIEELK